MTQSNACRSPGFCTCPGMKRCPWCGYTEHDEAHLMDHRYCANAGHRMEATSPLAGDPTKEEAKT